MSINCGLLGLIPAYAGRTTPQVSSYWALGAHPRLRGADRFFHAAAPEVDGSSPLTRGGLNEVRG